MSLKKTKAIILRHRHFGNTSFIFTLYTKDYGKIETLAKGIKKGICRGEGSTEIFSHIELIYYERESQTLRLLSHLYPLNSFKSLRTNPLKFAYASYLIELIGGLIHGEEKNENIYYLLLNSLRRMENEQDINRLIHFFEIKLIGLLGYGLEPAIISPSVRSVLRFLEKADFQALSRLKVSRQDEGQLKAILQNYLNVLLGNKPLCTLHVIENLEKIYNRDPSLCSG